MFKVLVIAYYYPPLGLSGVHRTLKFVKYMKNYNWEPVVLTTGNIAYFAHDYSLLINGYLTLTWIKHFADPLNR